MRASLAAVLVGTSVVGGAVSAGGPPNQQTGDRDGRAAAVPVPTTSVQTTADAALEAVARFIWGERERPADADGASWVIEKLTDAQVGGEAPFVKPGDRVWRLTGRQQRLDIRTRDGSVESLDRTIEAYVHAATGLVLKVVLMDEGRSPRSKDVLEPLEPSRQKELAQRYEEWEAPTAPGQACLLDALEEILRNDPYVGAIGDTSRIVAHAIRVYFGTMLEHRLWSVDLRDGRSRPSGAMASTFPETTGSYGWPSAAPSRSRQIRYLLDLDSARMRSPTPGPASRGEWERRRERERREFARVKNGLPAYRAPVPGAGSRFGIDPDYFADPYGRLDPPYIIYEAAP